MKYDKLEAVIVFSLVFDSLFYTNGGGYNQSPDYILEKFNQCFTVAPDKFKAYKDNDITRKYAKTWGVEDNFGNILNIISWISTPNYKKSRAEDTYDNFQKYVCDFKELILNEKYMVLHFVAKQSVDKVLSAWQESNKYKKFKRLITIQEITDHEV